MPSGTRHFLIVGVIDVLPLLIRLLMTDSFRLCHPKEFSAARTGNRIAG
jgi:hypothetical protein